MPERLPGITNGSERHQISADPDWYEPYAISLGIRVGDLVFISGQAPIDEHGDTVGGEDFDAQVIALRREFFTPPYPADTIAQIASLAKPEWQIEIEAIAVVPGSS